jgi:hypothetical protein
LSNSDQVLLRDQGQNCICHYGGERCPCDRGAYF